MLFFPTVVLVASCAYLADALPGGAPAAACDNLTPNHFGIAAQTSEVPFVIDVTQFDDGSGTLVYTPGRTYTLTLADPSGERTFRGFFVQSRLEVDDTTRVGVFAVNASNSRLSSCPVDTDGITHVQETPRIEFGSMTMQWTAPAAGTGPIRFAYAVVQVFSTFWADQRSDTIEEAVESEEMDFVGSGSLRPSIFLLEPTVIKGLENCDPSYTEDVLDEIDRKVEEILMELYS